MSWSFTGLGVSYYLVRGSTWGQILLSQSKAMKIKELNNLLLCFVEIQFYDLLIRWCHESCFYESQFFPTKLAACFDLLKTNFCLRIKIYKICNHKPDRGIKKSETTNSLIHEFKMLQNVFLQK